MIDQTITKTIVPWMRASHAREMFAQFCASILVWIMIWALPPVLFFVFGDVLMATLLSVALIGMMMATWAAAILLKYLIGRARPFQTLSYEPLIQMPLITPAFPSGHATISFSIAAGVALVLGFTSWTMLFVAAALLVAFGRVAVGVHYFSDVIVGSLLGSVLTFSLLEAFSYVRMLLPPELIF